jgi:hypothetical protein
MAIPGKPSARLTLGLKLITGQRLLRFSILKETPAPRQNGKIVFGQEWIKISDFRLRLDLTHWIQYFQLQCVTFKGGCFDSPKVQQDLDNLLI